TFFSARIRSMPGGKTSIVLALSVVYLKRCFVGGKRVFTSFKVIIEVLPPGMKRILEEKLRNILRELQGAGTLPLFDVPEIKIERSKEEQFGEYSTNIALMLSKAATKKPLELADLLKEKLSVKEFDKIEVAAPGYMNFYLSQESLAAVLKKILSEKEKYGESTIGKETKINNEFISGNPTGPLHLGNARGGFYSDVLSRVLRKTGHEVVNEYYVNDAGEQVLKLGHSVLKDEEAVYGGDYINELAEKFAGAGDVETVGRKSAKYVLDEMIKKTLEKKMNIHFDSFISERDMIEDGYVD